VIYVIGSGLTGIAAAAALVKRGYRPTILDAGVTPDPEVTALKARLASVEPDEWSAADLARVRQTGNPAKSGIPRKLSFGSDFAYRDIDNATSAELHRAFMLRSFARGGFSNVWGAVIQRFPADEFQNWPLTNNQLTEHYAAVGELMMTSSGTGVSPSTQSRALYEDLHRNRLELETRGIRFDYATLAVRSPDATGYKGCRHCGLCLYGCPYDSIFAAAVTLSQLVREGRVCHVPDVIVDRVRVVNGRVCIDARSVHGQSASVFEGDAVFVAAGLLESARIILNSTLGSESARRLHIKQSDIFTMPMLRYRSTPEVHRERLHTLCQMVLNIRDNTICDHPVHLQLYGYNDLYPRLLSRRAGLFARPLKGVVRSLSHRLFMVFGYLHSQVSSRVYLTQAAGEHGRLRLEGEVNPEARKVGRAIARKLFQSRKYLRTWPVSRELKFDVAGGGLRSGGCFPMMREPAGLETDIWGRIPGLQGIHVVDSSVLPSIPAGPLAFTAMATAHRIAFECPIRHVQ
jgi:ferredoxin